MKSLLQQFVFTFALLVAAAIGAAKENRLADSKIGEKIPNLVFRDAAGKTDALYDLKDKKAIVIVFLSFDCPVSKSYSPTLIDLAKEFGEDVSFVGLTTNDDETAEQVAKKGKEFGLEFPVYRDEKLRAASALEAEITPEAFVLDKGFALRYRGRIDDRYAKRLVENAKISRHDLQAALKEIMGGQSVSEPVTKSIGCAIQREVPSTTKDRSVTYYKDVLPILQDRCQSCHRPGEVGPFSLMTFKQAANWADDIKGFTKSRRMPPWKVTGGKALEDDRRLTDVEISTLAKWVDNGCPEGDAKEAPPAKIFPVGWQLGTPDLILTPDEDFVLGPTGPDHYRVMVLPTKLTEDKFVVGVEVRPGNSNIAHHALNFYDQSGNARKLNDEAQAAQKANPAKADAVDVGPGYVSSMGVGFRFNKEAFREGKPPIGALGGWAPGGMPKFLPEGVGYYLPAGANFLLQMHYHRNGKVERDRPQVGLYFAKKPIEKPMLGLIIPGRFKVDAEKKLTGRFAELGYIPAGDSHFVSRGIATALEDCTLYTLAPHMHLLGKTVKITMIPPTGDPELLIEISDWDFNWQEKYTLKKPIAVKVGTQFEIEATYDNSAANPTNPSSPPIDVRFGEQTTEEMLFGFLGATKNYQGFYRYILLQKSEFRDGRPKE